MSQINFGIKAWVDNVWIIGHFLDGEMSLGTL